MEKSSHDMWWKKMTEGDTVLDEPKYISEILNKLQEIFTTERIL